MVWAVPVSLAATKGIARTFFLNIMAQSTNRSGTSPWTRCNASVQKESSVIAFYSSRYWDVSLPWVRICIHRFLLIAGGFPHSEISGSKVIWHLAETYRSHNTSFIASWSLGIHHTPLHSCKEHYTPLCGYVDLLLDLFACSVMWKWISRDSRFAPD